MVFSSIPAYLDPSNWQQQQNPQVGATSGIPQFPLPPPPPPQPHLSGGGGGGGGPGSSSIRPGSMADRARMANIPLPETALKCPRCESTNTKFCYFNNYSLTQPRHFCKTCRRYWTRGGALRSVPVGGGCRRNKRSKGSSSGGSKSPAVSGDRQTSSGNSTSAVSSTSVGTASLLGLSHQIQTPLRFMAPLSQLSEYGIGDIGLMNYNSTGISAPTSHDMNMNFQLGSSSLGGGGGIDQWRFQPPQISSMASLDFPSGLLYPFHGGVDQPSSCGGGYGGGDGQVRPQAGPSQVGSVKMEDSPLGLNLSRQFLGIPGNNNDHQFWSTGTTTSAWTDVSGFSSSSNTNPL